jgi:orotidine-5'-phosphate decarboxylase
VVTPRHALESGADVLVIGRPITGAADPRQAIADIVAGLSPNPVSARNET